MKSDKKGIVSGFRLEENHFKRESDQKGRQKQSKGRWGSGNQREICNEMVKYVVGWKERKKEGTYVKRAMWWRGKISYGRLLHLSSKEVIR